MYDLIITWHEFCNKEENEILRATYITLDAVVEIVKQYNCNPSLHIKIFKVIELHPTPEQVDKIKEIYKNGETHARLYNETESYSCINDAIFNIRR